jgi:nucleotide-binding universal stress UspA family protein
VGLPKEVWTQPDGDGIVQMTINRLKNDVPEEAYLWCKIELAVGEGRPDQEILAYAEDINADLICLGSHGEGQRREFLGSNADHVLRRAPCPALVVRSTVQPECK